MNLDWVIPCRYVEIHDNLGTIVGAGIDTYWVPELPTAIQVVLAVRLLAMADELNAEVPHMSANRVRDPRGEVMSEVGGEFRMGGSEGAQQEWLNGIMVTTIVAFEATEEGAYTIEHEVDGTTKSLPIHIVHGPPPGIEWPVQDEPEGSA
jgi:hypothetical protein